MQLRYAFRLYPEPGQRVALARAFGCARVVFNDAVRARENARAAQNPFPTASVLSRQLITEAKNRPERSWLGEVSAVVLQQALRDVEAAYRSFFASLKGERKGKRVGAPRFRNRKPRNPHRNLCRVAAQQQVRTARILGLQPEEHVKRRARGWDLWDGWDVGRTGLDWLGPIPAAFLLWYGISEYRDGGSVGWPIGGALMLLSSFWVIYRGRARRRPGITEVR